MSYQLLRTPAFVRAARRLVKRRPDAIPDLGQTLTLLEQDIYHPRLKTHRLKGPLEGILACSVGYDLRILFQIIEHERQPAVLLLTMGSHDEVY